VRGTATENGRRRQLVEFPQTTPLVVRARSGWRCWLVVGEAPRRGPSTSGLYRFHPWPSAYRDRSRLGHQLGVRSSCRSSSAATRASPADFFVITPSLRPGFPNRSAGTAKPFSCPGRYALRGGMPSGGGGGRGRRAMKRRLALRPSHRRVGWDAVRRMGIGSQQ